MHFERFLMQISNVKNYTNFASVQMELLVRISILRSPPLPPCLCTVELINESSIPISLTFVRMNRDRSKINFENSSKNRIRMDEFIWKMMVTYSDYRGIVQFTGESLARRRNFHVNCMLLSCVLA